MIYIQFRVLRYGKEGEGGCWEGVGRREHTYRNIPIITRFLKNTQGKIGSRADLA